MSTPVWTGAFSKFKEAWKTLPLNRDVLLVYLVVQAVTAFVALPKNAGVGRSNAYDFTSGASMLGAPGDILNLVLSLIMIPAGTVLYLWYADKKRLELPEWWKLTLKYLVSALLAALLVGLAVMAGFVLFIVPAFIFATWFAFTLYAVVDKGMGPVEAMKYSKGLAKGNAGKIWGIYLITFAIAIGAMIITALIPVVNSVVASLVVLVGGIAMGMLYRHLQNAPAEAPVVDAKPAPSDPAKA